MLRTELQNQLCREFKAVARVPAHVQRHEFPTIVTKAQLDEAERIGAKYIATGHYARAENGAIYRGQPENDQSYMLCRLTPDVVYALLLPLAPYKKTEVRALAEELDNPFFLSWHETLMGQGAFRQGRFDEGRVWLRAAYAHAVADGYRFYSYGDASLLFRAA